MLALGSVHSLVENQIESGNVEFDIKGFLENVVLRDVTNPHGKFQSLKRKLRFFFQLPTTFFQYLHFCSVDAYGLDQNSQALFPYRP